MKAAGFLQTSGGGKAAQARARISIGAVSERTRVARKSPAQTAAPDSKNLPGMDMKEEKEPILAAPQRPAAAAWSTAAPAPLTRPSLFIIHPVF